jgi:NADPH-dependent 2,4-dienoyl-CoA reductase/sulfur reductase-like enzyme
LSFGVCSNVPDVDKIREWMDSRGGVKHATVIGGGFIGVEMAENLAHMKIPTTLVDVADQIMTPMDKYVYGLSSR